MNGDLIVGEMAASAILFGGFLFFVLLFLWASGGLP